MVVTALTEGGDLFVQISQPFVLAPVLDRQTQLKAFSADQQIVVLGCSELRYLESFACLRISRHEDDQSIAYLGVLRSIVLPLKDINLHHKRRAFRHEHVGTEAHVLV